MATKIPAPANPDETLARFVALRAEFKALAPHIVKVMIPLDGLKKQRQVRAAWLEEFYRESGDIALEMKESIKVYGLSEPEPEPTPETPAETPAEPAPSGKAAPKRRSRAAAKPPQDTPAETPAEPVAETPAEPVPA